MQIVRHINIVEFSDHIPVAEGINIYAFVPLIISFNAKIVVSKSRGNMGDLPSIEGVVKKGNVGCGKVMEFVLGENVLEYVV